jgi:hypothetical protein
MAQITGLVLQPCTLSEHNPAKFTGIGFRIPIPLINKTTEKQSLQLPTIALKDFQQPHALEQPRDGHGIEIWLRYLRASLNGGKSNHAVN